MNIVFADLAQRGNLLPLTYTRPTAHLRCGIVSLEEKWQFYLKGHFSYLTATYLSQKFPIEITDDNWVINPLALPTESLVNELRYLDQGTALYQQEEFVAARVSKTELKGWSENDSPRFEQLELRTPVKIIKYPWHLFQYNKEQIAHDYYFLTKNRQSAAPHESCTLIGESIF
ncbi:hypothetical protein GC194_07435, partial [bacterium]|nr:hypothetical protein [bacterium]